MMLDKLTAAIGQKISPDLRKVIGNTAWLFGEKIMQMGLGLFVGGWVGRYLGPERFGLLSYAQSFTSLLGPFATLGLNSIVIHDIARNPSCKDETLGSAFAIKLTGSITATLLAVGASFVFNPNDTLARWLILIVSSVWIFQSIEVIDFWFQSQTQAKYAVRARNGAYVLISLSRIVLILLKAPLVAFALAMLAESILAALAFIVIYRLQGNLIEVWKVSLARAKKLLKDSLPLIFSGVAVMVYMRIDQPMLKLMSSDKELGIYAVAVKISELWYFVPAAITQSFFPSIVQSKEISEDLFLQRMQKLFNLMAILGYAVAIPTMFLANYIIVLIYGWAYVEAGIMLTILMWTGLFVSLGIARDPWFIPEGWMKFMLGTTLAGGIINMILNVLLIPKYGGTGAAIATVAAQFVASYAANALFPKTRKVFIAQTKAILLVDTIKWLFKKAKFT